MLLGQYDAVLGYKSRIAFPKKFREVLGDKLIITRGFEHSLIIVSEEKWQSLLEGSEGRPFTQANARETQRFLLGGASSLELDTKGRFILPEYLRKHATIGVDAVFVGISRYVELWDKKLWEVYEKTLSKNIESIAEQLSESEKS